MNSTQSNSHLFQKHAAEAANTKGHMMATATARNARQRFTSRTLSTSVQIIPPELAREIVETCNTRNRGVVRSRIDAYIAEMKAGTFTTNGDAIRFADDGTLLDGQHRLWACAESGVPLETVVVVGLPQEVFATIDTGAARTLAHTLGIDGVANPGLVAAVVKMHQSWVASDATSVRAGGTSKKYQALRSRQEQIKHAAANPGLARSCAMVVAMHKQPGAWKGFPRVIAFCHAIFSERSKPLADQFVTSIVRGDGLAATDPFFVLRARLIEDQGATTNQDNLMVALCIKAWNAKRTSARIVTLKWAANEKMPEVV